MRVNRIDGRVMDGTPEEAAAWLLEDRGTLLAARNRYERIRELEAENARLCALLVALPELEPCPWCGLDYADIVSLQTERGER